MKGDTELIETPLGAIFFVLAVALLIAFITGSLINYQATLMTSSDQLNTIDLAHMVENCLKNGHDYIPEADLQIIMTKHLGYLSEGDPGYKTMKEKCPTIKLNYLIKIESMGNPTVFDIGYDEKANDAAVTKYTHSIYTNVGAGNDVKVAKLYVMLITGSKVATDATPASGQATPEAPSEGNLGLG